jgi:tryptophan halogenase
VPYALAITSRNGYVLNGVLIADQLPVGFRYQPGSARLDGKPLADPRPLRFTAGRRRLTWNRNVVGIGLAGGFLEPLESTSIYLIQIAITQLIDYLTEETMTTGRFDARVVAAYNRWMEMEYDRVRDFLILHYHAIERDDAPIWNYCRTMPVPDSLRHKLELFRTRGHVITYKDGLFLEPSWLAVYFGQRVMPEGYDPRADAPNEVDVSAQLALIREKVQGATARMPAHEAFLQRYCPAPPLATSGARA